MLSEAQQIQEHLENLNCPEWFVKLVKKSYSSANDPQSQLRFYSVLLSIDTERELSKRQIDASDNQTAVFAQLRDMLDKSANESAKLAKSLALGTWALALATVLLVITEIFK